LQAKALNDANCERHWFKKSAPLASVRSGPSGNAHLPSLGNCQVGAGRLGRFKQPMQFLPVAQGRTGGHICAACKTRRIVTAIIDSE
jgi:hypothetical protein